jgi:hypothetical protein
VSPSSSRWTDASAARDAAIAADGGGFDEALDDLIDALREYSADWNARLRLDRRRHCAAAAGPVKRGTRQDHEAFVTIEGWEEVRNARGRKGSHHATYELLTPAGEILRTRIGHPPDRATYGAVLWSHILRDQLEVTSDEFWNCVDNKAPPGRGAPPQPTAALPAQIVYQLIHTVGVPEATIAQMSREEALARLNDYWSGLH